ncbi:pregnancy zone protein-like [Leptodactylus fuscus]|uniref:pregnancy zone protein-like n=1 Tax=Leptodactylus fuscus TaxID=238119 RepID=UPI003F4E60A4
MDRYYHSNDKTFSLVEIIDPNGNHIMQWRDVPTKNGFAEMEFHLADELPLGEYQISLPRLCKKQIKVKEYELKRFEVKINTPANLVLNDKSLHMEICGSYTHGTSVYGSVDLSVCARQYHYRGGWDSRVDIGSEEDEGDNCIKMKEMTPDSGKCLSKDISLGLFKFSKTEHNQYLEVKAKLTESQTGRTEKASAKVYLDLHKKITFLEEVHLYQKGLPFHTTVKLVDEKKQPMGNKDIYLHVVEYDLTSGHPYEKQVTDENGLAHFVLNTSTWDTHMSLKATLSLENDDDQGDHDDYDDATSAIARLTPSYTRSKSQITLITQSTEPECDTEEKVTVRYDINRNAIGADTDHLHFVYLLRTKTGFSLYKEHTVDIKDQLNNPNIHGSFPISFHVGTEMYPIAMLIVFIVLPTGETVANLAMYRSPLCVKEKMQLKFSEDQVHPGASVNLDVSARAGSVCSIRSLDKGQSLQSPHGMSLLEEFTDELSNFMFTSVHMPFMLMDEEWEKPHCPENETALVNWFNPIVDAAMMFAGTNIIAFTNTEMKKPVTCVKDEPRLGARSGVKEKKKEDKDKAIKAYFTRKDFPERWIFELVHIPAEGHTVLNLNTPHSITKWVTDGFCLGKTGFASVSNVELTTFQPYFIDMIAPYSVVQAEIFTIQALIFSHVKGCLLISVALPDSEDLAAVKNKVQTRCVCDHHAQSFTWDVTAIKPKTIKVQVQSGSIELKGECTEDTTLIGTTEREDRVEKTIVVKPMGVEEEKINTFLMYPGGTEEVHVTFTLPERLVKGSDRAHVFIQGDIMATVAVNLDNIINLPEGCGEQKASKMLRYGHTLEYLKNMNELTPELKDKLTESMTKMYQNQLTYRTENGSYSFFAEGSSPSLWITALTLKAFTVAQKWIPIDQKYIQEAEDWLKTLQKPDGCFKDEGYYFNNELEADNEVSRTSFVVMSLLENEKEHSGSMVEDALGCLRRSVDTVTVAHTQALLAYALSLSGDHELRDRVLKKLDEKAIKKDGTKRWDTNPHHRHELETPSYILLTLLHDKTTYSKHMEECAEIARIIVSQQNSRGGFQSSQDSTLALQALAKYAKLIDYKKGDSAVTIQSKSGFVKTVDLHKGDGLLVHQVDLPETPGEYDISIKGEGMALVQTHYHYNIHPEESKTGPFSVNVSAVPSTCSHESHMKFDVQIDVRYVGKREKTNMVVILIEPVSGYIPNKSSIKKLEETPAVSRTEVTAKKISIYMEHLTHQTQRLHLSLEQESIVENLQPASVVVIDYYIPDLNTVVEYNAPCHGAVSHCAVNPRERSDCGRPNISKEECEQKGCCFDSSIHGTPWCFHHGFKQTEQH